MVHFRAVTESTEYSFEFRLYEVIQPDKCQFHIRAGSVTLGLRKKSKSIQVIDN